MRNTWTFALLGLLLSAPSAAPQEKSESREPTKGIIPLSVRLTFVRSQGEKKISSLPYILICNANDRRWGKLRMGIEVPVMVAAGSKDGPPSIQYKNVGTNIDCSAASADEGRFRLELTVEQSSVYSAMEEKIRATAPEVEAKPPSLLGDRPVFRTFNTNFTPILRDGQSAQYTAATDPVSGEVVRIDVTLSVVK
jgi:type II secretory pathway component GspD/PulD (secretin)